MDWFKKHIDMFIILGTLATGFLWVDGKFSHMESEISGIKSEIANLKTEVAIIKTVMIMQRIMPKELAIEGDAK